MLLTTLALAMATVGQGPSEWYEPFPAHKVIGNVYYVGSKDLATFLITTPKGHILINSGFERTVPLIQKSVESLGFKMTDVKILLASHAHSDHVAGHALLQKVTGAKVYVMRGDDQVIASGGKGQYMYTASRWDTCKVDRVLEDRDEVKLGGVTLVARLTPGHTRGCTTWTWRVEDGGKKYDVVVIGSPNVNPGFQLVNNKDYPEIAADFAKTFEVLKSLPCDVFLGAHGGYYGMVERYALLEKGQTNAFVNPKGYKEYVAQKERAFRKTLAVQQGKAEQGAAVQGTPPAVSKTINRGLQFLATDALAWKKKHNCVSCHHAALVIWAMREGKERGHAVDEPALRELTKWTGASGDGSNLMRKPPEKYGNLKVMNLYTVLLALAFEAGGGPADDMRDALKDLLTKIKADQTKDGPWEIWPEPGPKLPLCGASAEVMSTLATLALLPDADGKGARDKSLQWLAARTPEADAQADALRLILWRRAGQPAQQSQALVKRILARQNIDGGWSQTKERASDAFAIGQALYALIESGVANGDSAIQKAQVFLAKSQRPDGSWEIITRAAPPGHKLTPNVPINGAGTAWATLGLMRTVPVKNAPRHPGRSRN
jgi:metallo-beta-lactamase class B